MSSKSGSLLFLISCSRDPNDGNQSYAVNTWWLSVNVCPAAVIWLLIELMKHRVGWQIVISDNGLSPGRRQVIWTKAGIFQLERLVTLHLVIENNWLYELLAQKIFFCPFANVAIYPVCEYVYWYMCGDGYLHVSVYVYVCTCSHIYISVHMMYYLWMICPMQLFFNFGNKLIFHCHCHLWA